MDTRGAAGIEPDTKDWTWVLDEACPECGFEAGAVATDQVAAEVRASAARWRELTDGVAPDVLATRVRPDAWSVLEYSCHVRDVHRIFAERVRLMLAEDDPTFPNWDQDATAVEEGYDGQDPATVLADLGVAAELVATSYDAVPDDAWQRRGLRDNGSAFTIATLGAYHLHDVVHHVHDIESLLEASS